MAKKMNSAKAQVRAIELIEAKIITEERVHDRHAEAKKESAARLKKLRTILRDIITEHTSPLFNPDTGEVLDHSNDDDEVDDNKDEDAKSEGGDDA